jgi:hypothetical protein
MDSLQRDSDREQSSDSGPAAQEAGPIARALPAGVDAPPVPPELAQELYGHLAEPLHGADVAELEAQAAHKRQAVAVATEAKTEKLEPELPPTKENLTAELDAAAAREEEELDGEKTQALADLDAKIDAARQKMDGALLGESAVAEASAKISLRDWLRSVFRAVSSSQPPSRARKSVSTSASIFFFCSGSSRWTSFTRSAWGRTSWLPAKASPIWVRVSSKNAHLMSWACSALTFAKT